ncbi:Gfo/Idh/MocA family protein [Emticicia sp. TH156]|uniref:Gfo/Idh/MocA family protein n=1 Tax=Emticicia sp. TH156 TaxID=2067454 RepID=UPI000C77E666|nr:Gfo/Idh/MocA family oxidoreductase [Emticicia sp. TH156]PLK44395.1 oxidoreductase [Emticicia sp. TH156]
MPDTINWGIIGCGDVTEVKSGPAFNKVPASALIAVMRRDAARAEDYAHRHGVPKWYADAHALITDPAINAIYVATPPSSHELYALAAIAAGKPVYVEKPMADDYAAALRIAHAAQKAGVKLVVAHYRRAQQRFRKVKELLAGQAIGDVRLVRLELAKPPLTEHELADPRNAWRVDPVTAGGGLFHDLAPHQLDLMYYFFGEVERVTGLATNQGGLYHADDMVVSNVLFKNGVVFNGTWCFNAAQAVDYCEIQGSKGKISFAVFGTDSITIETGGNTETIHFDALAHVQQPMIAATVQYFLGKGLNPCSGFEGAEVMRMIENSCGVSL